MLAAAAAATAAAAAGAAAAAAAAATAAATAAAATAAAAVSTVYRPAQNAQASIPGGADGVKRKPDDTLAFRPVCPELDIRGLRKKLKAQASRPADPLLARTPREQFPVWSEDGLSASGVERSSSSHLGNGSFGSVEPVTSLNRPGQKLAMKLVCKQSIANSNCSANSVKEVLSDAARELRLLLSDQNKNSLFLMSAIGGGGVLLRDLADDTLATTEHPEEIVGVAILMEEMTGGDLHGRILKLGALPEEQCRFYVASILLGLEDLHSRHILHRDIKVENILIGSDGYAKIADFGLSKTCETVESPRFHGVCGTSEYFAPEIAGLSDDEASVGAQYCMAVDLWAAGVLTYYLLEGYLPFESQSDSDPEDEVDRQILAYCEKTNPLSWTKSTPAARDFVAKLLQQDPMDRLGMASQGGYVGLRKHPWFTGFNWKALMSGRMKAPWVPEPFFTGAAKRPPSHQPEE